MVLVEEGKCKIQDLNNKGLGVGETEYGIVELPYVLPGDEVNFERHAYRDKSNCILKTIETSVATRAEAPCEYFGACGGCLLQHLTEEDYTKFKLNLATNALSALNITSTIKPLQTIKGGNRRRANLEAIKKNGDIYLGFHRFHSHQIININKCIALTPSLSNIIFPLKQVLVEIMFDKQKLQMFVTEADNGIDIAIEIQKYVALNNEQRLKLLEFAKEYNITRLTFRYRKTYDVIYEQAKPYILFDGIKVEVDAYCFLQANKDSDRILSELVLKYLQAEPGSRAIDLFCGRGTYTLPLSKVFRVDGFESDKKALESLGKAALENSRNISLHRRDLFAEPLNQDELKEYSLCVINPPRAGAEAQIKELAESSIMQICYISCNPETFARDARILIDAGYILKEVTPVDQFYWSPHLELVGSFSKL